MTTTSVEFDIPPATRTSQKNNDRFRVNLEDVIDFIFPSTLQHPLAASRLICFGLYGPLNSENSLSTGPRGCHQLSVWELDSMCLQIEREDIMCIYLHDPNDMGMLSAQEQELLVSQADAHLRKAKGRAMLPPLSKQDIYDMFQVKTTHSNDI